MCLLLVAVVPGARSAFANELDTLPGWQWTKLLGDQGYSYTSQALASAPDFRTLFVAGSYSEAKPPGEPADTDGIWVWQVGPNGRRLASLRLDDASHEGAKLEHVTALSVLDENCVLVVAGSYYEHFQIIKIDMAGRVIFARDLPPETSVAKIIRLSQTEFLLVGHKDFDLFLLPVTDGGELGEPTIVDRGKSEWFVDGGVFEGGQLVLLENSGILQQFYMGSSEVRLAVYEMISTGPREIFASNDEVRFPGRYGSFAAGEFGEFAVLYDKSATDAKEIYLKSFGQDLREQWSLKIFEGGLALERFHLERTKAGDYLVVGSHYVTPWIGYVTSDGELAWTFSEQVAVSFPQVRILGDDAYIVSSTLNVDDELKLTYQVRIMKARPMAQ